MNFRKIEGGFEATPDGKSTLTQGGMVAAAFPQAAQAGADMLKKGGNAVDAAAAAALSLCVCEPQASGLGGQSMALIHLNGKAAFLDGSGRVPTLARLEAFGPDDMTYGYKATSVPTTVAVIGYMVREYGRLQWKEIVSPALAVASRGYRITALQHRLQTRELPNFARVASGSGARYFLKKSGKAHAVGDLFKQPELAELLKRLASDGPEAFYTGETARLIDADMRANGGFLRAEDLTPIPWPVERPVLKATYRDVALVSGPPPAAGRSLFALLKRLEQYSSDYLTGGRPQAAWDLAQAIRKVLEERRANPIAPDRYDPSQDPLLASSDFMDHLTGCFQGPGDGGGQTTHVSVMDRWGNAVGITQSVNLVYASKAAADGLGFLYNDYLMDCDTTNPNHPNYLRPGGIPASFVAPVIVLCEGDPWLVTGSPGTERILSTVAQFLIHLIDGGLSMGEAMLKPRLHYAPERILSIEAGRFEQKVVDYLQRKAGKLSIRQDYSFYLGAIHAVMRCRASGDFQGVAEIRRDGAAAGY